MLNEIKKISEARSETLIVKVGTVKDTYPRLYVRDNQNSKVWGEWEMTTQAQHNHLINSIDNNKNRVSELGPVYLDMIK